MNKDELILRLRAALSWELAHASENPAFQAALEFERDKAAGTHINPLGIYGDHRELFEVIPTDIATPALTWNQFNCPFAEICYRTD